MSDRHACHCPECPCPNAADASTSSCASCTSGIHRPSEAIQKHLREGLARWIEMMPTKLGSSGLTDKQVDRTAEAWRARHDEQACPVGPRRSARAG